MLQSIEERMEDQLLEKESKRLVGEYAKGFIPDEIKHHVLEAYTTQLDFNKVNNHYDQPGQYTNEDFELCSAKLQWERIKSLELVGDKLREQFKKEAIIETLADAVKTLPNDQELGAAIREWYHDTEGKFI